MSRSPGEPEAALIPSVMPELEQAISEPRSSDDRSAAVAYHALLAQLVSRQVAPGDRITIDRVSRAIGVSQTPVREALTQLELEGLVTRTHNAGFRAAPLLSRERFDDLFEIRLLIEPRAAAGAARCRTSAQHEALLELAEGMRHMADTIERTTYGRFAQADSQLHDLIAAASGNSYMSEILNRLHAHIHLFRLLYDAEVSITAIDEHDEILTAITNGNATVAQEAMRGHILASKGRLSVAFDQ